MTGYQRSLQKTRQSRIPLARISYQLNRSNRGRKAKAFIASFLSLSLLITAGTAVIAAKPLAPYKDVLASLFSREQATATSPDRRVMLRDDSKSEAAFDGRSRRENENTKAAALKIPLLTTAGAENTTTAGSVSNSKPDSPLALRAAPAVPENSVKIISSVRELPSHAESDASLAQPAKVDAPDQFPVINTSVDPVIAAPQPSLHARPLEISPASIKHSGDAPRIPVNAGVGDVAAGKPLSADAAVGGTFDTSRVAGLQAIGPEAARDRSAALASQSPAITEASCAVQMRAASRSVAVLFESGSASISFQQIQKIRDFAKTAAICPDAKIDVGGHADKTGEQFSNLQLSWQRAEAVIKMIKSLGFKTEQFSPVGYSASRPLTADPNPKAQVVNRRVEFMVR